jgi:hypothetical protein
MVSEIGEDGLLHNKQFPYPTLDEVKVAGRFQLGWWFRFLPSPGMNWVDNNFKDNLKREREIMHLIADRFDNEFGGMDSVLSKQLGWEL